MFRFIMILIAGTSYVDNAFWKMPSDINNNYLSSFLYERKEYDASLLYGKYDMCVTSCVFAFTGTGINKV